MRGAILKGTMNKLSLHDSGCDLPQQLKPFERMEALGVSSLSDCELLAMLLRSGTKDNNVLSIACNIMDMPYVKLFGLPGLLRYSREDFRKIPGIGLVKSAQLECFFELSRRIRKAPVKERFSFSDAASIADCYMDEFRSLSVEKVLVLFLDNKGRLINESTLSTGSANASFVPMREIFVKALKVNAISFVVMHNHPAGDPNPSQEDRKVTLSIASGASLLGLTLSDHIIIGDNRYFSFKEHGYI